MAAALSLAMPKDGTRAVSGSAIVRCGCGSHGMGMEALGALMTARRHKSRLVVPRESFPTGTGAPDFFFVD